VKVRRPEVIEIHCPVQHTFAGIQVGLWKKEDIRGNRRIQRQFTPQMDEPTRMKLYKDGKKPSNGR